MDQRIYTLEVGGRPVLSFPAKGLQEGQTLLKEAWLRDDLRELKCGGKPIWDGLEKLTVRAADTAEFSRFDRESKLLPDDGDLPIVYIVDLY